MPAPGDPVVVGGWGRGEEVVVGCGDAVVVGCLGCMFSVKEEAARVVSAPSSVYPHRSSEPAADGDTATGIEKFPAVSGTSIWLRTTTVP
jgi:hypothetical protein